MRYHLHPIYDSEGSRQWVLFEHGNYYEPVAILTDSDAQQLADEINSWTKKTPGSVKVKKEPNP